MKSAIFHFLVAANLTQFPYPPVKRNESCEDEYHGVKVKNPYKWLENLDSSSTQDFISSQNKLTDAVLEAIPTRRDLKKAYSKISNRFTNGIPIHSGSRYFYKENSGIYMKNSLTADLEILFDPLTSDESLGEFTFSENGEILAYSLSKYGSDWKTVHFRKVATRQNYPDVLRHTKWPDLAWTHDNMGIFYNRYPVMNNGKASSCYNKVYYHRLNTRQEEDILIAEFPTNPFWSLTVEVSHCGRYILVSVFDNFKANAVYIASLAEHPIRKGFQRYLMPLFPSVDDAEYTYVSNINSSFYFVTNKNANNGRLIAINVANVLRPLTEELKESIKNDFVLIDVIAQSQNKMLEWAHMLKEEQFIVCYLEDVKTTLELIHAGEMSRKTIFPLEPVKITQSTVSNYNSMEFFFRIESFLVPGTVYRCDDVIGEFNCSIHSQDEMNHINLNDFTAYQVFFRSKDNTAVPMFIIHKKNLVMDGTAPAILTGYGGFKFNYLPDFSVRRLFFIKHFAGVYAVVNLRGGGEYGRKWHQDGMRLKKQNTFDDFIAAAQFLIRKKYTRADHLAIEGSSNGGLLVATCINQRPQLFGTAIIEVGVLDMLRFQNFTTGYAWCSDYGCSQNEADFQNLLRYSPLHNIKRPNNSSLGYPAVMVVTSENDDRVVPSHSYKYIAELQHTLKQQPGQKKPLLLRVNKKSGHETKTVEDRMDTLAFLMEAMNLEYGKNHPPPEPLRNAGRTRAAGDVCKIYYLLFNLALSSSMAFMVN